MFCICLKTNSWQRCYYPHWLRDSVSPLCGIFCVLLNALSVAFNKTKWENSNPAGALNLGIVYTLNFCRTQVFLKRYLGPEYMFEVEDQFSGKRLSVCCTIVLCLETFYCECVLLPNDTIYLYTCFMLNLTQHIISFSMFPDHLRPNTVDSSTCLVFI